jgi:hypothetical protein
MGERWKSVWMGSIAAVLIALAAGVIMDKSNMSVSDKFSTSATRL